MEIFIVCLIIVIALGFDFTNGFHDAANAIAVSISTKALPPKIALFLAAGMNLLGSFIGTEVANTIAKSIVAMENVETMTQLLIVLAALIGAVLWNLLTWSLGLPTSSSHALIGGLAGAGIMADFFHGGITIEWLKIVEKVIMPMFLSPAIGFTLSFAIMLGLLHLFQNVKNPRRIRQTFKICQIFTSSMLALGHGLQDAQKSMGIIFMAAIAIGLADPNASFPFWIKASCACAIALGTYTGGFKIMKTLGRKIVKLNPVSGFVSEAVGASVLWITALGIHAPISTTHVITSSIIGSGASTNTSAVRWGVTKDIVGAWVFTLPGGALIGGITYFVLHWLPF